MILESGAAAPFFEARQRRIRESLAPLEVDALLVTEMVNVRYLCGFSGTAGMVLVTPGKCFFLTDFRYGTQAVEQTVGVETHVYKEALGFLRELLGGLGVKRLGFESKSVTSARAVEMSSKLDEVCSLVSTSDVVEKLRLKKDEAEVEAMRALIGMLGAVLPEARGLIRPGAVEADVALELEYKLRKLGAEGVAFEFIVASGARSALPHGVASGKAIEPGDVVILDWGVKKWGYNSDNTRTFALPGVTPELEDVYKVVLEANMAAIEKVRPGTPLKEIDGAARDIISKAGWADYFGHGTGHGVGMMIHEDPVVSWRSEAVAEPGMVFTIEPGVYLPGKGGVRIEDMALVTDGGSEILSSGLPKETMSLA